MEGAHEARGNLCRIIKHSVTLVVAGKRRVLLAQCRSVRVQERHVDELGPCRRSTDAHHQPTIRRGLNRASRHPVREEPRERENVVAALGRLGRVEVDPGRNHGWGIVRERGSGEENPAHDGRHKKDPKGGRFFRNFVTLVPHLIMSCPPPPAFGLSNAELQEVIQSMLAVVWRVGCDEHIDRLEVVHDAFVTAMCKPISERPPMNDQKRFVAWMCALAEFAALSSRKSKHRVLLGQGTSESELGRLLSTSGHAEAVAAREVLRKAFAALDPDDQVLVLQHEVGGKTITEIARELDRAPSTLYSRHAQAMSILRAAVKSIIAAVVLLFTKNARAQGARWTLRASRLLTHVTQTTCAMTVTMTCGAILPASSSPAAVHHETTAVVQSAPMSAMIAAAAMPLEPPVPETPLPPAPEEVAPVKPFGVDKPDAECSASGMKTTKIVSYLQGTVIPFAFLVAPTVTQLGCAGSGQQTPPRQEPEEKSGGMDPYEGMCEVVEGRGERCPTRTEWYASMGLCADGVTRCRD